MIYAFEINGTMQGRTPDEIINKIHEQLDPVVKYCKITVYGVKEIITG